MISIQRRIVRLNDAQHIQVSLTIDNVDTKTTKANIINLHVKRQASKGEYVKCKQKHTISMRTNHCVAFTILLILIRCDIW